MRTFAGAEGVLGRMGLYRAAFASIDQTEKLLGNKIGTRVIALGGENGPDAKVGEMVTMVARNVETHTLTARGHFMPEERPGFVIEHILSLCAA